MIKKSETLYLAEDGKTFIRKADGYDMGDGIDLGINDTIDNYEEIEAPEKETKSNE